MMLLMHGQAFCEFLTIASRARAGSLVLYNPSILLLTAGDIGRPHTHDVQQIMGE